MQYSRAAYVSKPAYFIGDVAGHALQWVLSIALYRDELRGARRGDNHTDGDDAHDMQWQHHLENAKFIQ